MTDIKNQINHSEINNPVFEYGNKSIKKFLGNIPSNPPFLIGTESKLEQIHQKLFNDNNLLLLVNGEGGIGKTTIASAYYHQYLNQYKHLIWMVAESGIEDVFINIALILGLRFADGSSKAQQVEATISELAELDSPILLVIDNANDLEDLEVNYQLLRKLSNIHLLLTSRITEFHELQVFPIEHLNPTDARTLFIHYYQSYLPSEEELLNKILVAIDYNTLVIELLSKNLNLLNDDLETPYPLQQLLDDLQNQGVLSISQRKAVSSDYILATATPETIILAMYDLGELTDTEQALLSVFAVLPAISIAYGDLKNYFPDITDLSTLLLQLAQKSWLSYDKQAQSFKTNPIISEISRQQNKHRLYQDCMALLDTLIDKLAYEANTGHVYIEHVIAVNTVLYAETLLPYLAQTSDKISELYDRIGNFYQTYGNLDLALKNFNSSAALTSELYELDPDNSNLKTDLAVAYSRLGKTYIALGNLELATQFYKDFNKLIQELYESYPDNVAFKNGLAISYSKLGETHSSLGNLEKALQFFEDDLKLTKELYEDNPNNVAFKNGLAVSYAKLAMFYDVQNNQQLAIDYMREAKVLFKQLNNDFPTYVEFERYYKLAVDKLESITNGE